MNNDLKNSIDNFIDKIKDTDEYKNYLNILNQVNKSNKIIDLTDEIKNIEKKLVLTPSIELESILKEKEEELNNIPLYLDYKDSIEELNNLLILIKNRFDIFVEDISI